MRRASILLVVAALLAGGCGNGLIGPKVESATRGQVGAVMVSSGPPIDGTLNSKVWEYCPPLKLGKTQSEEIGQLQTTARVLFDAKNMYVAFECREKDTSKLVAAGASRDDPVWGDDSVEVFVSPDLDKGYYQFAVNSKGVLMDGKSDGWSQPDTTWNGKAAVEAKVAKDRWVVTLAIPLKDLGAKEGKNQTWSLNLNRSRPLGGNSFIESSWSSKGASNYHDTSGWGKITGLNIPPGK